MNRRSLRAMDSMNHGRARTRNAVRKGWLTGLALLSWGVLGHAETVYVSGHREVMLRSGPSVEHRILAVLETGNRMETQGEEGDYQLVTLPDGRQGYVLKSFLTTEAPPRRRVQHLAAKVESQEAELGRLRSENLQLKADNERLTSDNLSNERQLRRLRQERADHRQDVRLWWFVAGAGVLLTGWLMGWTRVRLRRKARGRSFI